MTEMIKNYFFHPASSSSDNIFRKRKFTEMKTRSELQYCEADCFVKLMALDYFDPVIETTLLIIYLIWFDAMTTSWDNVVFLYCTFISRFKALGTDSLGSMN